MQLEELIGKRVIDVSKTNIPAKDYGTLDVPVLVMEDGTRAAVLLVSIDVDEEIEKVSHAE